MTQYNATHQQGNLPVQHSSHPTHLSHRSHPALSSHPAHIIHHWRTLHTSVHHIFTTLLLLFAVGVGQAWAQTEILSYSFTKSLEVDTYDDGTNCKVKVNEITSGTNSCFGTNSNKYYYQQRSSSGAIIISFNDGITLAEGDVIKVHSLTTGSTLSDTRKHDIYPNGSKTGTAITTTAKEDTSWEDLIVEVTAAFAETVNTSKAMYLVRNGNGLRVHSITVVRPEASDEPVLKIDKTSLNVAVPSYMSSNPGSVTLTGRNLTDGTYQVTQPSVDGLTISPTGFTVTDGAVNQTFSISYNSAVAVASASADFTFATSDADMRVTVTATYGKTVQRAKSPITVSEETTWDFNGAATQDITLSNTTSPTKNEGFIYTTLGEVKESTAFDAMTVKGQYAYYQGTSQVNELKFTTTVPGKVKVSFNAGTTSRTSELYVNGAATGATSNNYTNVEKEVDVPAGEVVLAGMTGNPASATQLRFSKVVFTPNPTPNPTYPITATWDFSKAGYTYSGNQFELTANTGAPLKMTVNNTGVRDNGNSLQLNTGTTFLIPVVSTSDVITVTNFGADGGEYNASYTIGSAAETNVQTKEYSPTASEVESGHVTLTAKNTGYLIKIQIVQQEPTPQWTGFEFDFTGSGNASAIAAAQSTEGSMSTVGISYDSDGNPKVDNEHPLATFTTYYHGTTYGLQNPTVTFDVPGPVTITMGQTDYSGTAKIKNSLNSNVIELPLKNSSAKYTTANPVVDSRNYTGEACTITIEDAGFIPYIKVEKYEVPDVLPEHTVTYYDADGTTVLGTQKVTEGEKIGTLAYTENEVTVADGSKFRRWKDNKGAEVSAETTINADLNVYACVTAVESASITMDYTYDFDKPYYGDEHEIATATDFRKHSSHGWDFKNTSSFAVQVAGPAKVYVGLCNNGSANYTLSNGSGFSTTFSAKGTSDKEIKEIEYTGGAGTLTLTADGQAYLHSVRVVGQEPVDPTQKEKVLYKTTFADWTAAASSTAESTKGVKTIDNQDLTFSLMETQVAPAGTNDKFTSECITTGYLMAAKTATPYIKTTTLANVTSVKFVHAATGSSRGWGLKVKGDGDADWVTLSDAYANPSSGQEVEVTVNRKNVQLWFYNLNGGENAYMTSLEIKGMVKVEPRTFTDFKVDLRTDPYTVVAPADGLPTGVTVTGTFYDNQHGYSNATITVPVDGPVKFTIGGCSYTEKATVSVDGGTPIDIDTNTPGCDNGFGTYTKFATYTYNVEAATTLTFNLGEYCPYFFAEACDYVPDVTVTYYNTDGSMIAEKVVPGGSALTFEYGASDVIVPAGQKFRGWFESSSVTALKVAEGKTLTENIKLYAKATKIEEATVGSVFDWDLTKQHFYQEDHELIEMSGKYYNNHGWVFAENQTLKVKVAGNAVINLALCQYANDGATITCTDDNGAQVGSPVSAKVANDGSTASFIYTGTATTLTFTFSNTAYVHAVKVFNLSGDVPTKDANNCYNVAANDAAGLMLVLSMAQRGDIVYLPNGTYDLGAAYNTIVPDGVTVRGESMEGVLVKNNPDVEGIGITSTFQVGSDVTLETLTLKCRAPYGSNGSNAERSVCLMDRGNNNVFHNIKLDGLQDTYYSWKSADGYTSHFYECTISGNTDFICGNGNVWFEKCTLQIIPKHNKDKSINNGVAVIVAPNTSQADKGYIFNNCIIENGNNEAEYGGFKDMNGNFYLGRGWQNYPKATYINTTMKILPKAEGFSSEEAGGAGSCKEKVWKETGSVDKVGNPVDTSSRPAGTVIPATDDSAKPLPAPTSITVDTENSKLKWDAVAGAIGYNIYKGGVFYAYYVPAAATSKPKKNAPKTVAGQLEYPIDDSSAEWDVRAINEMGVLGRSVNDPIVLADVAESTTWDWSKVTAVTTSDLYDTTNKGIKLTDTTNPTKTDEVIMSTFSPAHMTFDESFKANALKITSEYPVRENKYAQGGKIMFHTTVPGTVSVTFTNTGGSNSDRFLTVNGTKYGSGSGSGNGNKQVTTEVSVPAGDVVLSGALEDGAAQYLRFYKIVFSVGKTNPTWNEEESRWEVYYADDATDVQKGEALKTAITSVGSQTTKTLWIPNGTYDFGTTFNTSVPAGVTLIGESQDGVIIKNQPVNEGIGNSATLSVEGANVTIKNLTIRCRAPYDATAKAERGCAVRDKGNNTKYVNVTLDGLQDTYYSNGAEGMKATFDNCTIMGNVDFVCGSGNVTFNYTTFKVVSPHNSGGTPVVAAPATYTSETEGYVFNDCTIEAAEGDPGCLTDGHSSTAVDNNYFLARGWFAGNIKTDRTPRATFNNVVLMITPKGGDKPWTTMGGEEPNAPVFTITLGDNPLNFDYTDVSAVVANTNDPFAFATATDRTEGIDESQITGAGINSLEEAVELWNGDKPGTSKEYAPDKHIILLQSDGTTDMKDKIENAITNNDIIIFDGGGTSKDFIVGSVMSMTASNKTILGMNGARLCTEWYLKDTDKAALDAVNAKGQATSGVGGQIGGKDVEPAEYVTRTELIKIYGESEPYRKAGIFSFNDSQNLIIRNIKFVGPGSVDVGGEDLMAFKGVTHAWVDHCEFTDGIDGNFDITNQSDFVTVSWNKFSYTERSYVHQNSNLVGSSDDKTEDEGKLNITFAYNEWGSGVNARMPMARYGKIHMLNNYYVCTGNGNYTINPRIKSEFLIQANVWASGVNKVYHDDGATAVTWGKGNTILSSGAAGENKGAQPVVVPYDYSDFVIDPAELPAALSKYGGAVLTAAPNYDVAFSDEAKVMEKTNAPFAYATANSRDDKSQVSPTNITGGGMHNIEDIMAAMEAGDGYTVGETKTIDGKKAVVLQSANTVADGKETRVAMDDAILNAITNNDIIVLDGDSANTDFVLHQYIRLSNVNNKTIVGINGARLCTEWYLTDYFKSILENVPTSSGTGVNSASTAEGTGGDLYDKDGKLIEKIKEEGEFLTRKYLYDAVGNEAYRNSGIFYIDHSSNIIIRNFQFVGPGSLDCAGYDLMAIIDDTHHCWVDHCEFIDGMDGNFDITNRSDFVTVSWCQFRYTDRSYAHQNTNLVGSSDDKTDDRQKLNITFAYNEWGANCRARMPMARFGRIHMLNNYYNCPNNSEYAMNPRIDSEFLIEGNVWARGVRRAFNYKEAKYITWKGTNLYHDPAALEKQNNLGDKTVTVPYQYDDLVLDPNRLPDVLALHGGAVLYKMPYFTTDLGVAGTSQGSGKFTLEKDYDDCKNNPLIFSVWAKNAHTFQWYRKEKNQDGAWGKWVALSGETKNTLSYTPASTEVVKLQCVAYGVSGKTESQELTLTIRGKTYPTFTTDLDDTKIHEVYSDNPHTFTVAAKPDAVTYQWYKATAADKTSATVISGATEASYVYTPAAAEIFYLFCRTTFAQDTTTTDSKVIKVKGVKRDAKFHYYVNSDKSETVTGGSGGYSTAANVDASDDVKCSISMATTVSAVEPKVSTGGIRFSVGAGHTSDHMSVNFTNTTSFASGAKIYLKMSSSSDKPNNTYGFYISTSASIENKIAEIKIPTDAVTSRKEPYITTIDLPAEMVGTSTFYLIPIAPAEKQVNLHEITVYTDNIPADNVAITKDLEESYDAVVDRPLELSIEATDAASYQWYINTTKSTDNAQLLSGATESTYNYTATEAGTKYIYCVVTGTKVGSTATSSIAKVEAKVSTSGDPLIWIFDDYTSSNYNSDGNYYLIPKSTTTVVSVSNGKNLNYVTGNSTESRVYKLSTAEKVDDTDYNSYLYMGGSGSNSDRYFVTDALSGSGTLTIIYAGTVAGTTTVYDNANTATPLGTLTPSAKTAVDLKLTDLNNTNLKIVTSGKSYFYAVVWTPQKTVVVEKGIYSTTFQDWTAVSANDKSEDKENDSPAVEQKVKTKDNQDLTFTIKNTQVIPDSHDAKTQSPATDGYLYAKKHSDEYKSMVETSSLNNVTKVYFLHSATGTSDNRGWGLQAKGDGDTDWVSISTAAVTTTNGNEITADVNKTNCKLRFYNLNPGNYAIMTDLVIYAMMEANVCEDPTYTNEWDGPNQKWNYTFTSETETAHLKYTIDAGEEHTVESNTATISLTPKQKVVIWAIDSEGKVPQSSLVKVTAEDKPKANAPVVSVSQYSLSNKGFTISMTTEDGAKIYYTTDGTDPNTSSVQYGTAFVEPLGGYTIKAISVKTYYDNSTTTSVDVPMFTTVGNEQIVIENGKDSGSPNSGLSYTVPGTYHAGTYSSNAGSGIKYNVGTVGDQKNIIINANDGFVITKIESDYAVCNYNDYTATLVAIYANDDIEQDVKQETTEPVILDKKGGETNANIATVDGLNAKKLDIRFTSAEGWSSSNPSQLNIRFKVYYEVDDTPKALSINGTDISAEDFAKLTAEPYTLEMKEVFTSSPKIVMETEKGYEHAFVQVPEKNNPRWYQFTMRGITYTITANVDGYEPPALALASNQISLGGGYEISVTPDPSAGTQAQLSIDGGEWFDYVAGTKCYALGEVKARTKFNRADKVVYTGESSFTCPSSPYTPGKPFAAYIYVDHYTDGTQTSAESHDSENFVTEDKTYIALKDVFNVINVPVGNSDAILDKRPDITDAKLVVISETIGGSGSAEIAGVGNSSTNIALTLKRDVVNKTNVLNFKMYTYGSSQSNEKRWCWALPVSLPWSQMSIVPEKAEDDRLFEVFSDAVFTRGTGDIRLWDNINESAQLNHLQPVTDFNETEGNPTFTPLAYALDPENEELKYEILHYYDNVDSETGKKTTYVGFGLSVNEWSKYNDNVAAIVRQIGKMIVAGRPLNSPLEKLVAPQVSDNADGSASIVNNNVSAKSFYVAYDASYSGSVPTANYICTSGQQPDADGNTLKYIKDKVIFAASVYNDTYSDVVRQQIKGNKTRYITRLSRKEDGARGQEARYPFEIETENGKNIAFPYNQSWSKEGYTVTRWDELDANGNILHSYTPGTVYTFNKDVTVYAHWEKNTVSITDLLNAEADEDQRTVKWEFLPSKGAPMIQIEENPKTPGIYPHQALLVGQLKAKDGRFIDLTLELDANVKEITTPEGDVLANGGKFNNRAHYDKPGTYRHDYAQVRTGTLMTIPAVYGMKVRYSQMSMDKTDDDGNGEKSSTYVSQSYLTDGTTKSETDKTPIRWNIVNPGLTLDANGAIVTGTDSKVAAANIKDNRLTGGYIFYSGGEKTAVLNSVESALYDLPAVKTGTLNKNSGFMEGLYVTYPALYNLMAKFDLNPATSDLRGAQDEATATLSIEEAKHTIKDVIKYYDNDADAKEYDSKEEVTLTSNFTHHMSNLVGANKEHYLPANTNTVFILKPAYGYYVGAKNSGSENYDADYTFVVDADEHAVILGNNQRYFDIPAADRGKDEYKDIPEDGSRMSFVLHPESFLHVNLKRWQTYTYDTYAYPMDWGNVEISTGTGRTNNNEYKEYPVGKKILLSATANRGYQFLEWQNAKGETLVEGEELTKQHKVKDGVVLGKNTVTNPFNPNLTLTNSQILITVGKDNSTADNKDVVTNGGDEHYVASIGQAKTGTAYYLFKKPIEMTGIDANGDYIYDEENLLDSLTTVEQGEFYSPFTSSFISTPATMTLYREGYTLKGWRAVKDMDGNKIDAPIEGLVGKNKDRYQTGTNIYYYYNDDNEVRYLQPILHRNQYHFSYRTEETTAEWDFRTSQYAEFMYELNSTNQYIQNTITEENPQGELKYCTHVDINGEEQDLPLKIRFPVKTARLDNTTNSEWCALGEGTVVEIPSGAGATFEIVTYKKITTTNIDGHVLTNYTEGTDVQGTPMYTYTYSTNSPKTSVIMTIGDDYTYYKRIKVTLPPSDKVTLTTMSSNTAYGTVKLQSAKGQDGNDIEDILHKDVTADGLPADQYTMGLGTTVELVTDRVHLYTIDHWEEIVHEYDDNGDFVLDENGNHKETINVIKDGKNGYTITETAPDPVSGLKNSVLKFTLNNYDTYIRAVYKVADTYQINYTSGKEAEGEAPGVTLIERGESFTVPASNHHLYLDGQTLKYWVDEDGKKYELGKEYTPENDLYLSPVFEVNEFTVMDINETATATWPLTRLGGTEGDKPYAGNGDVNVFYQSAAGVYVTQLWLGKDTPDDPSDDRFIDLKLDLNCTDGKVDNRSDGARCQVNGGTKFTVPVSQNCNISVNSQRVTLSTAGLTFEGKTPTISADGKQASYEYNGNSTALDIDFKENTYLTQVVAEYRPVQTEVPDLDYLTIDNISLGALGTAYKDITLAGLKSSGEATIDVDLSQKTADDVPVVKGTATLGGYVTVTQASLDNATVTTDTDGNVTAASTANVLVKTKDGVTVRVYKIHFNITPPDITPKIVDLKVDRKYQCNLQAMYAAALTDPDVEGTTYVNKSDYLRNIGAAGGAGNERVGINGVVTIKFNTVMKGATILNTALGDITTEGGQTLVFNYRDLDLDKVYHFTIPENSFETANGVKYTLPITFWFTTAKTAVEVKHKLIDFVVTHNQPSEFSVDERKMVAKGERKQMVTDDGLANIQALKKAGKIAGYGTLDEGIAMANDYKGAERFYILVPDGEYQLMGNDFIKSLSSAPIGNDGNTINALNGAQNVYNGITTVSHDNVSIIGQSREGTVIWNKPYFEGASYTATLKLNNSIANFYAQDLTLENRFDYKNAIKRANKANGVVFWDRGKRAVLKNVAMKSYQTIINTNSPNQFDDTRSYYEDCLISGHTYLLYGDGDHWFNNTTLQLRTGKGSAASVMIDAGHYDTQEIGYVLNGCTIDYEDATAQSYNEGKMMMAQPWKNSPAVTFLDTKFNVLPTADGYKQASSSGLLLRIHEYNSVDKDESVIDLSERSLRSSSPAAGSYDAVMTPREAAAYRQGVAAVLGGTDAYDPTLHTIQCAAPETALSDRRMVWNEDENALCYAVFYADEADKDDLTKYKLFTLTVDEELDISADDYLGMYFRVRAANQRGGLGPWSEPITYHFVGQYDLVVKNMYPSYNDDDKEAYVGKDGDDNVYSWSTICLPFGTVVPEGSLRDPVTGTVETSDKIAVYAVTKVNALDVHLRRVYHLWPNKGYVVFATAAKKDDKNREQTRTYRFLGSTARQEGLASDSTLLRGYAPAFIPDADDPDDPTKATPSTVPLNRRNASVTCYTLAYKKAFGIGFYKFNGETLAPYRAWLDADLVDANVNDTADRNPDSQAARLHFIFDEDDDSFLGDIDAIRDVYHDSDDPLRGIDLNDPSTHIYTLEGLRITAEHLRRGLIYIINGQKVQWR